ncbi:uncharacterized protein LOC127881861 [Dreissena polymorpha]|uniref:Uncharacterized protein n=1 Tax=Dreissena polymorpha TaxID=45954 RepID=A0A9D4JY06_DREPO|nr:uncharacterized protein LOC127881861 [Dreissena polymorpha]KAH3827209.1 hypothetical protein DPMN_129139 [Dreissena polymorpha]
MDRYGKGGALPLYQASGPAGNPKAGTLGLGLSKHMQISPYMVVASCVFWLCMLLLAVRGAQYALLYSAIDDSDLDKIACCNNFGGDIEINRKTIESYPKGETVPYLMRLGPESLKSNFKGTPSPTELTEIPPIVTAVSSDDFYHVQSLIRQWREEIKKSHPTTKFIIYDIGLYESELNLIKAHCECDVRHFDAKIFPNHVADIRNFAYRPIIIQSIIEEFGSILWLNPNMLLTRASDLNQLKYRGKRDFFVWTQPDYVNTLAYTDPAMFTYMKESRCCFSDSGLVDVSTMVFYRTNTSWGDVLKPWLMCALSASCIAPPTARYSGCFELRAPRTTGCHRYDQSALSIVLERMFQFSSKSDQYVVGRLSRTQDQYLQYFPEQPWTYTEMFMLSALPLTCLGGLVFMFRRRKQTARAKANFRKR